MRYLNSRCNSIGKIQFDYFFIAYLNHLIGWAIVMHRLLLLGTFCLLATLAHGQHLLQETQLPKHYQVYKETMTHCGINGEGFEDLSTSDVNYLMTVSKSGIQLRQVSRYKPILSNTTGALVCRLTSLKYLRHIYEIGTLFETYKAVYQSYPGGTVPPLRGLPNPNSVDMGWAVGPNGAYTLRVRWYYGPKKNPELVLNQSYFMYTLACKQLD